MKDLKELILEEKFAYTWQNAFICAMQKLFEAEGNKNAKEIMKKWFSDKDSSWELYIFLKRLGHEPASQNPEDLLKMMTSDENAIKVDDKFNLK